MARPKEFDRAQVAAKAAELFRQKGYQATSMRDLIARVGMSSSSIYAAFGGKHGLFLAALEHAAAEDRAMVVAALSDPAGVAAGLRVLFASLVDGLLASDATDGASVALTLRVALEALDEDDGAAGQAVMPFLKNHVANLTGVLSQRLRDAEAQGELALQLAPDDLALFLLLSAFNLTFVVKLTRDRRRLDAFVAAALSAVSGAPHAERARG